MIFRLFFLLLALAFTAACGFDSTTRTPTPFAQNVSYRLTNRFVSRNGVAVLYPEGWKAKEVDTHIILTDQQQVFIGGSVYIPAAEDIQLLSGTPTPADILSHIIIDHSEGLNNPDDVETFTVDGRPAASFYYTGDIDELYMVAQLPDGQFVIVTFVAPKDRLQHFIATAHDILASVEFVSGP